MVSQWLTRSVWGRSLVYLLVILVGLEPSLIYATESQSDLTPSESYQTGPQDEFSEFEARSEEPGPVKQKDSFRLANQRREQWDSSTQQYRSHLLRDMHMGEPLLMADFINLTNVKAEILEGGREFSISKIGNLRRGNGRGAVARHVFVLEEEDGQAIDIQFDREFLYVLTSKGKLFSVYMPLARTGAFNHVLPLIELLQLPKEMLQTPHKLRLKFAFRGHGPIATRRLHPNAVYPRDRLANDTGEKLEELPKNYVFVGSDLAILEDAGADSKILGLLDSQVTMKRVHFGLTVAAQMAATAAGVSILPELPQSQLPQEEWSIISNDPSLSAAFVNLGSQYTRVVAARAQAEGHFASPPRRDRFTQAEWEETYRGFERQALEELSRHLGHESQPVREHLSRTDLVIGEGAGEVASGTQRVVDLLRDVYDSRERVSNQERNLRDSLESGELDAYWRDYAEQEELDGRPPLLKRIFNKKNLNRLAKTLSLSAVVTVAGSQVATGDYSRWALYLYQSLYEAVPDALHTANYTFPYLLTAAGFLSLGIPILWGIGKITESLLGGKRRGFDFKRSLGWLATVQFARLVKMFYITGIESVFRNPTFITMLQRSMNPFRNIEADSPLGKRLGLESDAHPGLVMPGFGARWKDEIEEKRRMIGQIYGDRLNARSAAVLLAAMLVAHDEGSDPATVFHLVKTGNLPIPSDEEELKKFEAEWKENAKLLSSAFEGIAAAEGFRSLSEMSVEEFDGIYQEARQLLQKEREEKNARPLLNKMKRKWRGFRNYVTQRSIPFFASWGVEQSEILKNSLISQPIANESWRAAWIDYYFTTYQQAIIGGRADFSQPSMLYADPNGSAWLGYANPANVSDTVEQLAIHGIAVPSRNLIDFQSSTPLVEDRYQPLENFTLQRTHEHQGWGEGASQWMSGVFNLQQMQAFGGILWRSMYGNRFKMVQSGVAFSVVPRVALAGQGIGQAFAAWSFVWFLAPFFAFVWPFVVVGNTKLETTTAANYQELKDAQALINQGLRHHNKPLLKEGVEKLSSYYSSLPPELQKAVKEAQEVLKDPNFEVTNWLAFEKHRDKVIALWSAIEARNQKLEAGENAAAEEAKVVSAATALREIYPQAESEAVSPEKLLAISLERPPYPTMQNKWLQNSATFLIGVVPSTFLASYLFAHSYREDMNWALAIPIAATVGLGTFFSVKLFLQKAFVPLAKISTTAAKFVFSPVENFLRDRSGVEDPVERRAQTLRRRAERRAESLQPRLEHEPVAVNENFTMSAEKKSFCQRATSMLGRLIRGNTDSD